MDEMGREHNVMRRRIDTRTGGDKRTYQVEAKRESITIQHHDAKDQREEGEGREVDVVRSRSPLRREVSPCARYDVPPPPPPHSTPFLLFSSSPLTSPPPSPFYPSSHAHRRR